ncbi:MAG: hypothetical protein HY903_25295 [Deltaproteobacteria bacterium]|nr:hypothetical protein [Deltaproteobacteria bacterium]
MVDTQKSPIVTFTDIRTVAVIRRAPGSARARLLFWVRTLGAGFWRRLRFSRPDRARTQTTMELLANAARAWRRGVAAFRVGQVRSTFRFLDGLRAVCDDTAVLWNPELEPLSRVLLHEAWGVTRREVRARLSRIDLCLVDADPERSPEAFYWTLEADAEPMVVKDPETAGYVADELKVADELLHQTKGALKFLALHLDNLHWLARRSRLLGSWFSSVPSRWQLERRLNRVAALRERLAVRARAFNLRPPQHRQSRRISKRVNKAPPP